ncbi:hypothetical protein BRC60_03800, partial [Halobacteriales archaeon QH_1_68_42]
RPRRTRREGALEGADLDAYLRALDERLTTTYDVERTDDLLPRPDGEVHVVEYTTDAEGQAPRWTVELSWTPETDRATERSEKAAAPTADD